MRLSLGDKVMVRGNFGRGLLEWVTIVDLGFEADRAVFDYTDDKGKGRWAYLEQIDELRTISARITLLELVESAAGRTKASRKLSLLRKQLIDLRLYGAVAAALEVA